MPVSEDQLRQLLTERSDPARRRPVPEERIAVRIRRARLRRATGAGLLAVVVAAGVVSGVTLAHEHSSGYASFSGAPLPTSFTASDGAAYRRLALTSMTDPAQRSAALTVTAGSEPVDVMAACDAPKSSISIGVKVNGVLAGFISCQQAPQLMGLSVRPGEKVRITFARASSFGLPDINAGWRFAAYAWKPPATARAAPPEPRLPPSYTGANTTKGFGQAPRRLIASRSGDWPGDRTATFTVTYHRGRGIDVSVVCAGTIASRLQVSFQVDGSRGGTQVPCKSWTPGQPTEETTSVSGRAGVPITLTFRFLAPSPDTAAAYAKRAASWTIAVYEEQT
jgi:hypothetical protein